MSRSKVVLGWLMAGCRSSRQPGQGAAAGKLVGCRGESVCCFLAAEDDGKSNNNNRCKLWQRVWASCAIIRITDG